MKLLHRNDLFSWSKLNEERNLDFNSWLWAGKDGNVMIDPLPMSERDRQHLDSLGGAEFIVITNSDHCRDAEKITAHTKATLYGPGQEKADFPIACDRWLQSDEEVVADLTGSKTRIGRNPGWCTLLS